MPASVKLTVILVPGDKMFAVHSCSTKYIAYVVEVELRDVTERALLTHILFWAFAL